MEVPFNMFTEVPLELHEYILHHTDQIGPGTYMYTVWMNPQGNRFGIQEARILTIPRRHVGTTLSDALISNYDNTCNKRIDIFFEDCGVLFGGRNNRHNSSVTFNNLNAASQYCIELRSRSNSLKDVEYALLHMEE